MNENEAFWMVWSPQGRAPTHKHPTLDAAKKEAMRLAAENPGRDFVVLQSVGAARVPVQFVQHDTMPF